MALQPSRKRRSATQRRVSLKERVARGDAVFGCAVSVGHPALVEIAAHAGFDFVLLDFEHGSLDVPQAEAMTIAARATGVAPIWRVNRLEGAHVGRALDLGAEGVLVPHVKSAEQAREVVKAALYPPAGDRGLGPRRCIRFGADDPGRYYRTAKRETFVAIMIEDREAIEAIDEIAAVKGIDAFNIGTWDLSRSCGLPLMTRHQEIKRAIDRVLAAAFANDIACGVPPESPADAMRLFRRGVTFFECASVDGLLLSAGKSLVDAMRARMPRKKI